MAVPKRKTSKSKRNMRRAHKGLSKVNVVLDTTTGEAKLPHHMSLSDSYYAGRQILEKKEKSTDSEEQE